MAIELPPQATLQAIEALVTKAAETMPRAEAERFVAIDHGFADWPAMRRYLEQLANPLCPTWVGAIMGEDLALVARLAEQDASLLDSLHRAFEDPFRFKVFPVSTLLFASAGPPQQTVGWRSVHRKINFDLVRLLVEAGAKVDIDCHGGRPISWVRDRRVMAYLVERGADLNCWIEGGGTPLNFCVWRQDPERATMLLDVGADPNCAAPGMKLTCMHFAAATEGETAADVLAVLLDRGGDPSPHCAADPTLLAKLPRKFPGSPLTGETPLHIAAARGDERKMKILLDHGADRLAQTSDGRTPMDWARSAGAALGVVNML
jgi:ankyrin repeat protein